MSAPSLDELLEQAKLADHAVRLDNGLVRLQFGSAFVIAGISGSAVIAIAPMFRALPHEHEHAFLKKLLEHNAHMGGMASFAIQPDGWVVLHAARGVKGIDAQEFATLVACVGRFADQFDDTLIAEFYKEQPEATNQLPVADTD